MNQRLSEPEAKPVDYYQKERPEMLRFIPKKIKTLLDVGCGEGHFGKTVKSRLPVEVWGIELHPAAAENAKNVLDKVMVGNIEKGEIALPDDYFDCILFNDVLEHLSDPWTVLKEMRSHLKEGGYIIASIPNVRHYKTMLELLVYRNWDYTDFGTLDRTHLRFFTKNSMAKMFVESGYDVMTLEGVNGCRFSWKMGVLNFVLLNALDDMRFSQYACVARKK